MGLNMLAKAAQQRADDVISVPLEQITFDTAIQSREGLNSETTAEYKEEFVAHGWGNFPPVDLLWDGTTHWIGDGNHRYAAANQAGLAAIPARIKAGTRRDAILRSTSANNDHGLRRTNADKRRSVQLMLRDDEWRQWSDQALATHCAVDPKTVGKIRHELEKSLEIPEISSRKASRSSGSTHEVNTSKIGSNKRSPAAPVAPTTPPAPEPTSGPDRAAKVVESAPAQPPDDLNATHRSPVGQTLGDALNTQPDEIKAATFSTPAQPSAEQVAENAEVEKTDEPLTADEISALIDDFYLAYQVLVAAGDQVMAYALATRMDGRDSTRFTLIELILEDFNDNVKGQE